MPNLRLSRLAAVVLAIATLSSNLAAQQPAKDVPAPVDLGAFTKEIMALEFRGGHSYLAMWLPYEFFVAATVSQKDVPKSTVEKDLAFLVPYVALFVQTSIQQPTGPDLYADEKEVRARAFLRLSDGSEISPLEQVPPRVAAMMSAMKAILTQEGDAGSANMHLLIFPATVSGRKIVDTLLQDKLTLVLKANQRFKETSFTWRTPFDAVVKVPDCPRCKAGVSAKWLYCPYCGQKLTHR
ncbi:MAG TPA: zinc ribbon domain-containing protein [Pyrinomonadaceae bacterium]|nr:zinc ribbon domain-containing protein [Pyrinomonadaceae bacterium]